MVKYASENDVKQNIEKQIKEKIRKKAVNFFSVFLHFNEKYDEYAQKIIKIGRKIMVEKSDDRGISRPLIP